MPVRSLSSSVLKWPDRDTVHAAVQAWGLAAAGAHPDVLRVGYFGSYARGDWGVGSDIDLIVVVEHGHDPVERRAIRFDTTRLPVPADVLVFTQREWDALMQRGTRLARVLQEETRWVWRREG